MSQCPVCSSPIEDSFGLIECPGCHKILFADFDGTLKVHDETAEAQATSSEVQSPEAQSSEAQSFEIQSTEEIPEQLFKSDSASEPVVEESVGFDPFQVEEALTEEVPSESVPQENVPPKSFSTIDEINQFASSEDSSLKQGALIYHLTIKNIDTEDLKQEILDILKENKLNIDIEKLKFALPTLELKDLNPVKVSVIVSKIKHLPVDVEWTQKSAIIDGENDVD